MPGFDGTGPQGMGPMTGRGMGPCGQGAGQQMGFGRGMGRGMGRRMGMCPYFDAPTISKKDQKKIIEAHLKSLDEHKKDLENKLKDLN